MTLVIASATSALAFLMADGRLTNGLTGKLVDDDENKLTTVTFPHGSFAVGLTGLARIQEISTPEWFAGTLTELAAKRNSAAIKPLLDAVAGQLSADVMRMRLRVENSALSITGVGFIDAEPSPTPAAFVISNFEKFDVTGSSVASILPPSSIFTVSIMNSAYEEGCRDWIPFHFFAGSGANRARDIHGPLANALLKNAHPSLIAHEAYAVLNRVADTVASVGRQADAVYVTAGGEFFVRHLTDRLVAGVSHPISVDLKADPPNAYYYGDVRRLGRIRELGPKGRELAAVAVGIRGDEPTIGPRQPKGSPCFCGSRRKYRRCHGRWAEHWTLARPPFPDGPISVLLDGVELPVEEAGPAGR